MATLSKLFSSPDVSIWLGPYQLCLLQFNNNIDFKNNKTNYTQLVSIRPW